jgi:putative oxidoreductase
MAILSLVVAFAARALLVMLFLPFSALDKMLNFKQAVFMSLAILIGIADRMAAFILASYCIVTALLWKPFWKTPDFRLRGASRGRDVFWDFLKNLALAGGFLALAFGASASGFQKFMAHPLASSHPYSYGAGDR